MKNQTFEKISKNLKERTSTLLYHEEYTEFLESEKFKTFISACTEELIDKVTFILSSKISYSRNSVACGKSDYDPNEGSLGPNISWIFPKVFTEHFGESKFKEIEKKEYFKFFLKTLVNNVLEIFLVKFATELKFDSSTKVIK